MGERVLSARAVGEDAPESPHLGEQDLAHEERVAAGLAVERVDETSVRLAYGSLGARLTAGRRQLY